MTISPSPWTHPASREPRLHLDAVPEAVVHALAASDPERLTFPFITPYLAGTQCLELWRMRSSQIRRTPADAPWITRLVIDPHVPRAVGLAGFHGQPDAAGMVEVGYRIDPAHRRNGYARRALETLLAIAHRHPSVVTIRATISPENVASRALIDSCGFVETGEQWDEQDGLEIIFELASEPDGSSSP